MDITTVNDRHLYHARVTVRDSATPGGVLTMPVRVVRFGPPGWLTLADDVSGENGIELYPTSEVVSVASLREVTRPGQH
jgi:hypothetical protein